jgi:hypothetical protein
LPHHWGTVGHKNPLQLDFTAFNPNKIDPACKLKPAFLAIAAGLFLAYRMTFMLIVYIITRRLQYAGLSRDGIESTFR